MILNFDKLEDTLIVNMSGEIDHHVASSAKEKIDKEYTRQNTKNIELAMGGVTFMDSSGIGMIIGRYKMAVKNGGKVTATGVNSEVSRLIDISGLGKIIEVAYAK